MSKIMGYIPVVALSIYLLFGLIGSAGAISITASTSTGKTIVLSPGWNTFSTPKVLDNLTFQSGGTGLYFYALSSTGWQVVNPTIANIKPLEGYIVNNTNSGTSNIDLSYRANLSPMEMIFQKQLHAGWNILGITTINNPFASIQSSFMGIDFTRTTGGGQNYLNKIANSFYTIPVNYNFTNISLGESYGLFLPVSTLLYGGVQAQSPGSNYIPAPVVVSLSGRTTMQGKTSSTILSVSITAGEQDISLSGFNLTYSGALGFTGNITNVKAYRNGVSVGIVTLTNDKISISELNYGIDANMTQVYEIKADTLLNINNSSLGIIIQSTDDISATEIATGLQSVIFITESTGTTINFTPLEFTFSKSSTGNMTIAPGTNNVKFFDGKLQSSTPVSVRKITVTPAITGTGITAFVNDQLSVKLNGSEIATLTSLSGAQVLTVSFAVDATSPAVITIEASTKNSANIIPSSTQFTVALTDIRDSSNNPITPANLGAGSSLTGDTVTIKTAEVEIKTATLAAPSNSKIYSNTSSMEIGRFSISSMNESARLHRLVVVNTGSAILQNIIIGNNIKLYDISTGYQISATATINGNEIVFDSISDIIMKDTTKNYRVTIDTGDISAFYGESVILAYNTGTIVRDSNGMNIIPISETPIFKNYTLGIIPPTVTVTAINENTFKVRVTNPDTNTGVTLTGAIFEFKTALPGSTAYVATACLRDLGNTNTCGGAGTSGSGAVPGLAQPLAVGGLTTNMTANKNGGYVEFELYVTSANLLPTGAQLQVALTQLNYIVGGIPNSEAYVGTSGASVTFTK